MGTDIHTAVEVMTADGWKFAGNVFDSDRDHQYTRVSLEMLESLDDGQLLDALSYWIEHKGESHLNVGASLRDAARDLERRRAELRPLVDQATETSRENGWDYDRDIRPVQRHVYRVLHDETTLLDLDREELINAVLRYDQNSLEEEDYGFEIRLVRRAGDPPLKTYEPFDDRNYDLFAALADVRNGSGFAGVDTGDPIVPVAQPRGVPDDVDPATRACLSHEHTPSWLTLEELEEYDWSRPKTHRGIVPRDLYMIMRDVGPHASPWDERVKDRANRDKILIDVCGGIDGPSVKVVSASDLPYEPEATHVRVQWTVPLRDSINDRFFESWSEMEALVPEGGSKSDVRIVFDFDS